MTRRNGFRIARPDRYPVLDTAIFVLSIALVMIVLIFTIVHDRAAAYYDDSTGTTAPPATAPPTTEPVTSTAPPVTVPPTTPPATVPASTSTTTTVVTPDTDPGECGARDDGLPVDPNTCQVDPCVLWSPDGVFVGTVWDYTLGYAPDPSDAYTGTTSQSVLPCYVPITPPAPPITPAPPTTAPPTLPVTGPWAIPATIAIAITFCIAGLLLVYGGSRRRTPTETDVEQR